MDESVWFDHFFYPVVSPLFYVETLADLEKAVRQGRSPEKEVGIIAQKTPELSGGPCAYHGNMYLAELMGHPIPMDGRIPVAGARPVEANGQKGIVYEPSPEADAFSRWQEGKFLDLERQFAKSWRDSLGALDLLAAAAGIQAMGIDVQTCRSLKQAKEMADKLVKSKDRPSDLMKLAFIFLDIPRKLEQIILKKWTIAGYPPISTYAPFTSYILTVEIFFQIALNAHLIATERPSNRVDIAYLFYLPFCMLFVSTDKIHRSCAPLFLREDQDFVWGEDLKISLKYLNDHYSKLPESEKETGIMHFASRPPAMEECLVSKLWDRHMGHWRKETAIKKRDPEEKKELIERLTRFSDAPTLPPDKVDFDLEGSDTMTIKRLVRKKKGSWWQLPKNLKPEGFK